MMTDGKHEDPAPGAEDDAALWSLLERARRPGPVSPYFARRVLREAAALEEERPAAPAPGWLAKLWQTWHGQARGAFAGAAAVALLAVGVGISPLRWSPPPGSGHAPAVASSGVAEVGPTESESTPEVETPAVASEPPVTAQDVEIIADLDNLLPSEESRLWTDEDTTARY